MPTRDAGIEPSMSSEAAIVEFLSGCDCRSNVFYESPVNLPPNSHQPHHDLSMLPQRASSFSPNPIIEPPPESVDEDAFKTYREYSKPYAEMTDASSRRPTNPQPFTRREQRVMRKLDRVYGGRAASKRKPKLRKRLQQNDFQHAQGVRGFEQLRRDGLQANERIRAGNSGAGGEQKVIRTSLSLVNQGDRARVYEETTKKLQELQRNIEKENQSMEDMRASNEGRSGAAR